MRQAEFRVTYQGTNLACVLVIHHLSTGHVIWSTLDLLPLIQLLVQELSRKASCAADLDQLIVAHENYLGTLIRKVSDSRN
jgi:hypothetical protein